MSPSSAASSPRSSRSGSDQSPKEDKETTATRKELRNTSISRNAEDARRSTSPQSRSGNQSPAPNLTMSPKKKRTHDQVLGEGALEQVETNDNLLSQEPEKKRHRDGLSTTTKDAAEATSKDTDKPIHPGVDGQRGAVLEASKSSAFAGSGFSALASSSSPFGALGAAAKSPGFAGHTQGGFSGAANQKPTLDFSQGSTASPFSNLPPGSSNGFGGSFGSPFGASTTAKLTSFAKPGGTLKSDKKQRPFGAPGSEVDESSGDENADNGTPSEDGFKGESDDKPRDDAKTFADEKKKLKLQKVTVDDGEAGEATVAQARCKMYCIDTDNKEAGWKERGAGILKLNVPADCVDFAQDGTPIPGTFDASGLDEAPDGSRSFKGARLIMRQDQTHRLILNTVLLPAMTFSEKASTRAVNVMFTAFEAKEGDSAPRPFSVNMKMSAANAKAFLNEVRLVQRELQTA